MSKPVEETLIYTTGPAAGVQPRLVTRLEARDFVAPENLKQFTLYVRAIKAIQDRPETVADSFFQLGAIHGLPYERWNLAGDAQPVGEAAGYCQHKSVLFPTWHRPYVALFEQIVQQKAVEFAAKYTHDTHDWIVAGDELRLPYWDWARFPLPPAQFYDDGTFEYVKIIGFDGQMESVKNPLLGYSFQSGQGPNPPKGKEEDYGPVSKLPWTVRHPFLDKQGKIIPNSKSNIKSLTKMLTETTYKAVRPKTANLLTAVKTWKSFATPLANPASWSTSLEGIHDTLHIQIGYRGHMNHVPYAAFDPIFWLHHCNVDRVLALWQVINFNTWIEEGTSGKTWTHKDGQPVSQITDLEPFRSPHQLQGKEEWWTSVLCRNHDKLYYTYPELLDLPTNQQEASDKIATECSKLYRDANTFAAFPYRDPDSIEWIIRIRCKASDARDIMAFVILLGQETPNDPLNFRDDDRYVGEWNPFVNPFTNLCRNCVDTAQEEIEGFVPITAALMKEVNVMDNSAVKTYLRDNLKWVAEKNFGGFEDLANIPSLQVIVMDVPLHAGMMDTPVVGEPRHHHEVTANMPGGSTSST